LLDYSYHRSNDALKTEKMDIENLKKFEGFNRLSEKEKWYIENRLIDQFNWYDRKSVLNQRRFKCLKTIEYIITGLIVFFSTLSASWSFARYITILLSIILAIISSLQSLNKYQENWLEYRTTAETLKHELFLYLSHAGPYKGLSNEEAFQKLVERVESLISEENTEWRMYIQRTSTQTNSLNSIGGIK